MAKILSWAAGFVLYFVGLSLAGALVVVAAYYWIVTLWVLSIIAAIAGSFLAVRVIAERLYNNWLKNKDRS